ncbi:MULTISPECIES: CoA-binding protein [unclassified Cryobacterium]|uniref:CoA-binding protein n=1 Tax=unclassified Cryobacterium TaxID=2649013 RepID=UPI001B2FF854|nr:MULTISPECIES: CoA-binding protein [unclassified Cryobacterium]
MTDDELRALLTSVTTIAVVGASANPEKPSGEVPIWLVEAGFTMIPVNPKADEIAGQKVYRSLAEIPVPIDVVDVFRPSEETPDVARQSAEVGAKVLWLQLGITSADARATAENAGMTYLEDICIGATVRRLGIRK